MFWDLLDIPEFKTLEELCELRGAYVNMESELPDGTTGKLLNDSKTYLCCQVPINETECYGVAADVGPEPAATDQGKGLF